MVDDGQLIRIRHEGHSATDSALRPDDDGSLKTLQNFRQAGRRNLRRVSNLSRRVKLTLACQKHDRPQRIFHRSRKHSLPELNSTFTSDLNPAIHKPNWIFGSDLFSTTKACKYTARYAGRSEA